MQPTGDRRQNTTTTPHVRVPSALIYSAVSTRARDLWAVLDDLARSAPSVVLSTPQLAAALGVTDRHVRRLAAELQAAGWLDVVGLGGRGQGREYYPRGRARSVYNPVENGTERRTPMSGFPRSNPDINVRVSGGAPIGTARKEATTGCARCDLGWVEDGAGRVTRCACSRPPSPF